MKVKDIQPGKVYAVKVPQHVDVAAWHYWNYDRVLAFSMFALVFSGASAGYSAWCWHEIKKGTRR